MATSSSGPSRRVDPATLIRRARDLYSAARTEATLEDGDNNSANMKMSVALQSFKGACLLCPCNKALYTSSKRIGLSTKDIPLPTCHCKVYVDLISTNVNNGDGDKQAIYKLATKPCACGSGIVPCQSALHVEALDGMIAVSEAQKDYRQATKNTSLLITTAPHAPEGYLRLAKILRLQALSSRPKVNVESQCAYILSQACMSVRSFGNNKHEKLKIIERLIRKDIVRHFPPELQAMVLKHLPVTDLNKAMRVSKAWYLASRAPSLWKDLRFVKRWPTTRDRSFRPGVLNDIITNRSQGMAKTLTITDTDSFGIDDVKLRAVLRGLPKLEGLSLTGRSKVVVTVRWALAEGPSEHTCLNFNKIFKAICEEAPPGLKVLRLSCFLYRCGSGILWSPTPALARISPSLEELSLSHIDGLTGRSNLVEKVVESMYWPRLKKLVILQELGDHSPRICLPRVLNSTPVLKDLTLGGFTSQRNDLEMVPHDALERLCVSGGYLGPPPLATPTLRSLELTWHGLKTFEEMWSDPLQDMSTVLLDRLEHLCCCYCDNSGGQQTPPNFQSIQPSCDNGTLRSLHITFDPYISEALDLVLNKPYIHTLSCHSIGLGTFSNHYDLNEHVELYLDWVDTFRGLNTIGVYPVKTEKAWMVIARLMKRRPDIKTIFTDVLRGVYRDEILKRAAENGITIIEENRVPEPILEAVAPNPGPVFLPELEPRVPPEDRQQEYQEYSHD